MFQTRIVAPSTHRFGFARHSDDRIDRVATNGGMGIIPRSYDSPLRKNDDGSRDLPDIAIGWELCFAAAAPLRPALRGSTGSLD
jgi:hypothetical protein